MKEITRADIDRAQDVLREHSIWSTPLTSLQRVFQLPHWIAYWKWEHHNEIGSYKIRWAFFAISQLKKEQRKRWVVCASAGNHAQGVAYACRTMEVHGVIFMPKTTDQTKIRSVKRWGGEWIEIRLVGDIFDEAQIAAMQYQQHKKAVFIHPFNDRDVIIGQATVAAETFREMPHLQTLVVPLGWGGLISWAYFAAQAYGQQALQIIGVEPSWAASMQHALAQGTNSPLASVNGFVGWAAVAQVGSNTFRTVQDAWIEVISVPEWLVADTMVCFHDRIGEVVEPAGALGSAGVRLLWERLQGNIATIITGRCFSPALWPGVVDRAEKFRGEKVVLSITLPDRPWALQELLSKCPPGSVNIDNFHFDTEHGIMTPVKMVFRGDSNDIQRLLHDLNSAGFLYSMVE